MKRSFNQSEAEAAVALATFGDVSRYRNMVQGRSKKTRYTRRKARIYRRPSSFPGNALTVRRTLELTPIAASSVNVYGALKFTLDSLPNYTDFIGVFDAYCIRNVEVIFVPTSNVNTRYTGSGEALPVLHTAIDYNDNTTPPGINTLFDNESHMLAQGGLVHARKLKPHVSTTYFQAAIASGYGQDWDKWIDTPSYGVSHYGLKYCLEPSSIERDSNAEYRIYVKYHITFKKVI